MQIKIDRVAVFVDGDNVSSKYAQLVLDASKEYGQADVIRVYGNGTCLSGWAECAGFQFIYSGPGKNSSDLLLSVDAMDIALSQRFDVVMIASSDGDFSHLATRLRERGVLVVGIGAKKAPKMLRGACSVFRQFPELNQEKNPAPVKTPVPASAPASELDLRIKEVIEANSTKGMGIRIVDLSPKMRTKHEFKIGSQPERTWRGYLSKRPNLYDLEPRGREAKVRFKPKGFDCRSG